MKKLERKDLKSVHGGAAATDCSINMICPPKLCCSVGYVCRDPKRYICI
ncbi:MULTISPECIES: hypothetical protein [Elizabethkingia]|nr:MULTISPECIES: hypothetical protein [Elizabethkingia]MBG0513812.1 hypothetical protein [Elizabethkingia meningoseptica]MDE5436257.1 hypothetical protein [Elizabethkingia meningoseptica]MDE5449344.1 hypothetical protein [Elizabethkingia meningoseptica]MDE5473209.1 hypothetical protein [Elizabethkingia meningoseptica]MDE5483523.1 hypothetical protein [Elizabethkingia meningoseptica]